MTQNLPLDSVEVNIKFDVLLLQANFPNMEVRALRIVLTFLDDRQVFQSLHHHLSYDHLVFLVLWKTEKT